MPLIQIEPAKVQRMALRGQDVANQMLGQVYRAIQGRHYWDTVKVVGVLYACRRMAPYLTAPGVLFSTFLLAFLLPKIYDVNRNEIHAVGENVKDGGLSAYCRYVEPLSSKIPRASTAKPLDVGSPCKLGMKLQ